MFRWTVGTVLNDQVNLNFAGEIMCHSPRVTVEHCIRRNEHVNLADCQAARPAYGPDATSRANVSRGYTNLEDLL
jgi:hypothetical protein